ncbi:ribonuclease R family protein [Helicobacter sp.]|uniref:RNB domain-containing ribonuclease n=1 Tax=Helicobacter sp. TaxID=218 RepID=UPI0025C169C8|nr:ribonuclease R family protein [Helicobacter sp.]MBR2495045.1 VacB/RNase II family 3'-5' exoribonuclease [Helicobacter sp.]
MEEFLVSLVVGRRDIPKKFASVYEQLRACGAIAKDSRLYKLAPVFMLARIHKNSGALFAQNIANPKDRGLRLRRGRDRRANALADGDLVLLLTKPKEPRLIKVLSCSSVPVSRLLCLVQKRGKIIALDCKSLEPISLPFSQKSLRALPKHCVLEYSAGQITKVLGSLLDPSVDEKLVLAKYNFADSFSQAAQVFAQSFGDVDARCYPDRVNLCDKPFITIDPSDAKDHDDAVFWDQGSHTLYIAIADVSEYVLPNTELDIQAKSRCFSLYFPHTCYPMLPNALSQSLCSLRANEPKLALVWEIMLHRRTKLPRSARLYEALITPRANISYEQAQAILDSGETRACKLESSLAHFSWLRDLYAITQKLKAKRLTKGYDFITSDTTMRLNPQGAIESIHTHTACPSHSLIEESMLLANILSAQVLAGICEDGGIYRAHEPPSDDRIYALFAHTKELGYTIKGSNFHAQIQALQQEALKRGESARKQLDTLIIKAQKEARYTDRKEVHFGLGFEAYTHFTSPIRRYSDLIAHRLLKIAMRDDPRRVIMANAIIALGDKARKQIAYVLESSSVMVPLLNERERQISRAEAEFKDRKYAREAQAHSGAVVLVQVVDERYPVLGVVVAKDLALPNKHRLTPSTRLVLDNHCTNFAIKRDADCKSSSPAHNTAIPRILEEESLAHGEFQTTLESKKLDSSSTQSSRKKAPLLQGARVVISQSSYELMRENIYTAVIERVDLITARIYVQIP